MKRLLLFLLILLFAYKKSNAQPDSVMIPDPNRFEHSFQFYFIPPLMGVSYTIYPNLKEIIKAQKASFPSLGQNVGYGMGFQKQRWKVGAMIEYSLLNNASDPQIITETNIHTADLNVGYAFYYGRNIGWFINIGLGEINYNLRLQEINLSSNQIIPINDLFASPSIGTSPRLFHKNTFGEISVERTYRPKRPMSFNVNLKIGYRLGINSTPWESERKITLLNAPSDRVNQVFVQCIFVLGRNREKLTPAQKEARKKQQSANDWGLN
ncbi:hypothetical protein [Runella sp.]|uniref:hypothetical protein n=1 Tax=Runella sp. TaxID=1960881 RepID=UPI003D127EB1